MGLDQFDVAPDNKGGRKPKDEDEKGFSSRSVEDGEPFVRGLDREEWWQDKVNQMLDEADADNVEEIIPRLSGYTFVHPITCRIKLEEHGIHETDWDWYTDEYPMYEDDKRIKDHLGEDTTSSSSGGLQSFASDDDSSSGETDPLEQLSIDGDDEDESIDDESNSGLQSLVDNAK